MMEIRCDCAGYLEKMNYSNVTLILVHFIDACKCCYRAFSQLSPITDCILSVSPPVRLSARLFCVFANSKTKSCPKLA